MVDFNNETTVTQAPADLLKILRLEKRNNLFEAMEHYYKMELEGQSEHHDFIIIRARALNLVWELAGELERKKKPLKLWLVDLEKGEEARVMEIISELNMFCDEIGLTRIDIRRVYDVTRTERENKERRL